MNIKTFIKTRGRSKDYRFLGEGPQKEWWTQYSQYTSFEEPTLLINSDGNNWKVYLTGIPSKKRKDVSNTVIRFSFSFEGMSTTNDDNHQLICLIKEWLLSAHNKNFDKLSDLFDDIFPEELIESILNDSNNKEHINNTLSNQIGSIFKQMQYFTENKSRQGSIKPVYCIYDKNDFEHICSFVHSFICDKKNGEILYLNLIEGEKDYPAPRLPGNSTRIIVTTYQNQKKFPQNQNTNTDNEKTSSSPSRSFTISFYCRDRSEDEESIEFEIEMQDAKWLIKDPNKKPDLPIEKRRDVSRFIDRLKKNYIMELPDTTQNYVETLFQKYKELSDEIISSALKSIANQISSCEKNSPLKEHGDLFSEPEFSKKKNEHVL